MNAGPASSPRLLLIYFRLMAVLGLAPFIVIWVDILLHPRGAALSPDRDPFSRILFGVVLAPLILALAVLCIRRVPRNLIGWLLVLFAYGSVADVIRLDLLPLDVGLVIANILIEQFWFSFLLIPLYFPNGRLYPESINRWGNRLVGLIYLFLVAVTIFCSPTFSWGSGGAEISIPNPLLIWNWDYTIVSFPVTLSLVVAGTFTVILRYRRGSETERLQLRWLLFGVIIQAIVTAIILWNPPGFEHILTWLPTLTYYLIIPFSVAIALLRYRLYDVDLVIRRTLQYALLTLMLGLVNYGLVILLGQAFLAVSGQNSPIVVVLSTLVIAALFNPLRKGLQAFIDRRFYRRKFNSEQAVASFALAARNETEPGKLTARLTEVIQTAFQPEQVTFWMAPIRNRKPPAASTIAATYQAGE